MKVGEVDGRNIDASLGTLSGEGASIARFRADGSLDEVHELPVRFVSSLCFGGADMRDAWITASGTGKLLKCRWPRPGLKLNFNA